MQFNEKSVEKKENHLDEIKSYPEIIDRVIKRNLNDSYELIEQKRIWVGGGATSYVIKANLNTFFLKIKHRDITVESKLEEEWDFLDAPCLLHEKCMLDKAYAAGIQVPRIIFFDEEDGFQFLATEYVPQAFDEALQNASLEAALSFWKDLLHNVRLLYEAGIVHTDIHELNIRINGNKVILIDFEDAKELRQNCQFEESLDYAGKNNKSSLGEFPLADKQDYTVRLNSLVRMRQVFKRYIIPKTRKYIKECNYDSMNGICTVLDHGISELTYQSIHNDWFSVKGQREQTDKRPQLIWKIIQILHCNFDHTFVDVGSNNGLFCREIAKFSSGTVRCIGLEGFHKFNVLAKALAFIDDCSNVEYCDFLCGQDSLTELKIDTPVFMTICSVWHHIQNKQEFINQLKRLEIKYIFLEMPVQEECYAGRTWEEEVQNIKESLGFADKIFLGNSHDYNRPLMLISKDAIQHKLKLRIATAAKHIIHPTFFDKTLALINANKC